MIILKLQAGLGNQMFQYAYARALALRSSKILEEPVELGLDIRWFGDINEKDTKRHYALAPFNIQAPVLPDHEAERALGFRDWKATAFLRKLIRKIKRDVFGWSDYVFHSFACGPRMNACIEGYWWNSELYFIDYADDIRKEFTLKQPLGDAATAVKKEIETVAQNGGIPVLIHVRRGDYVTNIHAGSFHGAKDISYYDDAAATLFKKLGEDKTSRIHFFVVSDDIAWVKENLKIKANVTYVSRPGIKDYEEMPLMSLCHHHIISNSTFSWWGAWLSENQNKIVIGPKQWVLDPKVNTRDVMPQGWLRV